MIQDTILSLLLGDDTEEDTVFENDTPDTEIQESFHTRRHCQASHEADAHVQDNVNIQKRSQQEAERAETGKYDSAYGGKLLRSAVSKVIGIHK